MNISVNTVIDSVMLYRLIPLAQDGNITSLTLAPSLLKPRFKL